MRKVVKQASYILLFAFVFFVAFNVNALSVKRSSSVSRMNGVTCNGCSGNIYSILYTTDGGGSAWCLDPSKPGPNGQQYRSDSGSLNAAFSAGAAKIVGSGGSVEAKQIAIRLLAYSTGVGRDNGSIYAVTSLPVYTVTLSNLSKYGTSAASVLAADTSTPGMLRATNSAGAAIIAEAINMFNSAKGASSDGSSSASPSARGTVDKEGYVTITITNGVAKLKAVKGISHKAGSLIGKTANSFKFQVTEKNKCFDVILELDMGKYAIVVPSNSSYQRMIVVEDGSSGSLSGDESLRLCVGDDGPSCPPVFITPWACDASGSADTYEFKDPTQYKNCIIDPTGKTETKDFAGNTYEIKNYQFCRVSCREEYEFNLPGSINAVMAGHWFVLDNPKIAAKRSCVTSDIDYKGFRSQLKNLNILAIETFNEAKRLEAIAENYRPNSTVCSYPASPGCTSPIPTGNCDGFTSRGTYTYYDYDKTTGTPTNVRTGSVSESGGGANPGTCTCSCNTDFKTQADYASAANNMFGLASTYSTQAKELILEFNKCTTGWDNNMCFEPQVDFKYEEEHYMSIIGQTNNMQNKLSNAASSDGNYYCKTATNKNYDTGGCSSSASSIKVPYTLVSGKSAKSQNMDSYDYINIRKDAKANAEFEPITVFGAKHPTGEAVKASGTSNPTINVIQENDGKVFPIAMTTKEGTYNYSLTFSNIGQFNGIGGGSKCGKLGRYDSLMASVGADMVYTCWYSVLEEMCADCPPTFPGDLGTPSTPGGKNYFYRPVSLNDVFPNSNNDTSTKRLALYRNIGSNWTTAKGQATQKEIETNGAKVYEKAEYAYHLTPGNMQKIRTYNHERENGSKGTKGYADFNLKCDEYGIDCISDFLNEGQKNGFFTELDSVRKQKGAATFTHWVEPSAWKLKEGPSWK